MSYILQNESNVSLQDYQNKTLADSYAKLTNYTEQANKDIKQQKIRIYDLSLKEIGTNWVQTIAILFQELYQWIASEQHSWNELMSIIGKEDRMIYIGITFVFASLFIYFMVLP